MADTTITMRSLFYLCAMLTASNGAHLAWNGARQRSFEGALEPALPGGPHPSVVDGNASAISSIVFGKWNATRGETDGTMQVLLNRKKYNVGRKMIFNSKTKLTFLNRGPLGTKGVVKLSFSGSNDGAELAYNPAIGPDQAIHRTTEYASGPHDVMCHANWLVLGTGTQPKTGPCFDDDLHFTANADAWLSHAPITPAAWLSQPTGRTGLVRRFRSISADGRTLSCSNITDSLATPPSLQPSAKHAPTTPDWQPRVRLNLGRCGGADPDFLLGGSRQAVNVRGTSVTMGNRAMCKSTCPPADAAPTANDDSADL